MPKAAATGAKISRELMDIFEQEEAKLSGRVLPHEFLLGVVRGEPIKQMVLTNVMDKAGKKVLRTEYVERTIYPDLPARVDAAKAVAPYYAPRLAAQVVTIAPNDPLVDAELLKKLPRAERLAILKTLQSLGVNLPESK